jgi:hypothetical protein
MNTMGTDEIDKSIYTVIIYMKPLHDLWGVPLYRVGTFLLTVGDRSTDTVMITRDPGRR